MYSKFLIGLSLALLLFLLQGEGCPRGHMLIRRSPSPADGATLKEPPREVRIQFTEGLEIAFSQITVKGPNGEIVSQGKMRQPAQDTLAVDLKPLSPGNYVVEWQVLSVDTHVTEGVLRFTGRSRRKISDVCHRGERVRHYLLRPRSFSRLPDDGGLFIASRRAQRTSSISFSLSRGTCFPCLSSLLSSPS